LVRGTVPTEVQLHSRTDLYLFSRRPVRQHLSVTADCLHFEGDLVGEVGERSGGGGGSGWFFGNRVRFCWFSFLSHISGKYAWSVYDRFHAESNLVYQVGVGD